jgi:hypothetical protein
MILAGVDSVWQRGAAAMKGGHGPAGAASAAYELVAGGAMIGAAPWRPAR